MTTQKKTKKAKDKQLIEPPEKYKVTHKDKGTMLLLSTIVIVGLSLLSMVTAVYAVSIYLVIVGVFIEVSNAAVLYIAIREHYAINQYAEKSVFAHLPIIGQSKIYFAPILFVTYILWFLLVGFCAYVSAEKRNNQNTEGVTVELSNVSNQLDDVLLYLSSQQKKRQNAIDSISKSLSLCKVEIGNLNARWLNGNIWAKNTYLYPYVRPLERQCSELEKGLKEAKGVSFLTDTEAKDALQTRVSELRHQIAAAEKTSNSDKYRDFWMHLFFTFLCVVALTFITFQKARYDLFCGVGLEEVCNCEEPEERRQSRTAILTESLKLVRVKRDGNYNEGIGMITFSTFMKWHKNKESYGENYKAARQQIEKKYKIIDNGTGIPTLIKK